MLLILIVIFIWGIHLTGVTTTCSAKGFTTRCAGDTETPRRKPNVAGI